MEEAWDIPALARFLNRLASFSRLILFGKRGTGMSDRVPIDALPTLEERMDDVRAGLHTGEVEVMGERLGGIAVHIGARVAALASPPRYWFRAQSRIWWPAPRGSSANGAHTA